MEDVIADCKKGKPVFDSFEEFLEYKKTIIDMVVSSPLVSVIIPTYKRPERLPRAIESVLSQTYTNVEAIIVDDNNPDTDARKLTEEIMAPYADNPRVRYIKHEKNKNGSAARNTGAKSSNAKYLAFLDDDDEFLPEKISAQVKRLEELDEEFAVCYTAVIFEKEDGSRSVSTETREGDLFFDALTRDLSFQAGSNLFIRKVAFDSIGGFDESFKRSQDKEVVTRLLQHYKIAYAPVEGLLAHIYSDHSFVDPFQTTEYYVTKMQPLVDTLDADLQKRYWKEINKQLFYYSIAWKRLGYGFRLLLGAKVSFCDAISIIIKGIRSKYLNK